MGGTTRTNLSELVLRAIEVYNRYRSPEATAKLIGMDKNGFVIEFKGAFCLGCAVRDYFEDFIYELEDLTRNNRVEIKESEPTGPQSFRVKYVVRDNNFFDEVSLFREFLKERGISFREYSGSNACTKDVISFHFRTWLSEQKTKSDK